MFKILKGNVFNSPDYTIVHGCNCFNAMGAGIARTIKKEFPLAYKADMKTKKGDRLKLGTYTFAEEASSLYGGKCIINAYTQYTFWDKSDMFYHDAFEEIIEDLSNTVQSFSLPAIGLGLANGDLTTILNILIKHSVSCDISLYIYDQSLLDEIKIKFGSYVKTDIFDEINSISSNNNISVSDSLDVLYKRCVATT